jgi:hypothetical protein
VLKHLPPNVLLPSTENRSYYPNACCGLTRRTRWACHFDTNPRGKAHEKQSEYHENGLANQQDIFEYNYPSNLVISMSTVYLGGIMMYIILASGTLKFTYNHVTNEAKKCQFRILVLLRGSHFRIIYHPPPKKCQLESCTTPPLVELPPSRLSSSISSSMSTLSSGTPSSASSSL